MNRKVFVYPQNIGHLLPRDITLNVFKICLLNSKMVIEINNSDMIYGGIFCVHVCKINKSKLDISFFINTLPYHCHTHIQILPPPHIITIRFLTGLIANAFGGTSLNSNDIDDKETNLTHFKLMRIVGRGAFGKVRIVEHRESHKLYALKYINKDDCIKMDAVRNIIRERMILEELDHPFLCRLRFAFQDSEYMYMITDLMLGGDLHFHISRQPAFSEDIIRFWFAELAAGVKYLHMKRVVHRDIKPHNILMDDKGHVHITDFNIATHLHSHRPLTSNSGTGYYMAPEVFKGGGYNESVDWWSLGVTLYECIYKKRPFDYETTEELQAAIRRGHVNYPTKERQVSGECLAVIQGFLELNPNKRLGYGDAGWAALVRHPFFRPIKWSRLESKSLTPPFQPALENNFDLTYELEELLMDDAPLTNSRRIKQIKRGTSPTEGPLSKRDRDLLLIEEKFEYFDFTIFEKYEGFKDPVTMTVGDPPDWVKPAFEGAEQGDILPIKRITTSTNENVDAIDWSIENADISPWRGPSRSASTSNISSITSNHGAYSQHPSQEQINRKRSSLGAIRKYSNASSPQLMQENGSPINNESTGSLSEEYALSLQGIRKKQSTKSFRDRRERDRKSIQVIQSP